MAKKGLSIVILFVLLAATAILASCDRTSLERYGDRIADYRYAFFRYVCDSFTVDAYSGERETPFASDGKCAEEKTEYTLFTVRPLGDRAVSEITVTFGGEEMTASLAEHPFKGTYSAEFPIAVDVTSTELSVSLDGETVALARQGMNENGVDGEYALTLALSECEEKRKTWESYEILLRVSENTITAAGGWYWYVGFLHDGETFSVLVSIDTGEIVAVRG